MQVIKRDGTSEEFTFSKIEKVIAFACPDEEDRKEFLRDLNINLKATLFIDHFSSCVMLERIFVPGAP